MLKNSKFEYSHTARSGISKDDPANNVKKGFTVKKKVRTVKSSLPLNLEIDGFTFLAKHGRSQNECYKFSVSTPD